MAQVKKFNTGGSIQKMKYGSIIKNGTRYEMDEENMKRLESHIAAAAPDEQQSLANDWDLLMSGQDVVVDTYRNQRSTKPSYFSEGQIKRLDKDKPTESWWHAANKTDIDAYNRATRHFGTFDPSVKAETKIERIKLGPGSSKFEYRINDDGTKSYRSLPNTDELRLFDDIAAYLVGDDVYRSKYDISGWAGFNDLDTWYKGLKNPNFIKDLRAKILNGSTLTPDEEDYLTAIGLGSDALTAQREQAAESKVDAELKAKQDTAWTTFNTGNVWDMSLRDKQIVYDPNTGTYGISSQYIPSDLPKDTQGYWFNDDFVNQNSGYGYDWLNGKVFFNNHWYNETDLYNPASQLYQMLNNPNNDYYNKNKRGDYRGADAVLKTDWDGVYYEPTMTDATASRMGAMYQNPNLRYIETNYNRPDATYNGIEIDDTYNIWRYQDLGDSTGMDGIGRRPERWTITDAYGRPVFLDGHVMQNGIPTYDFNKFSGLYDYSTNEADQKISYTERASLDPNDKEYYNRYMDIPLIDANGNKIIEGWIDPDAKTVHVAINKAWGGTEDTIFTNMAMDVYSAIKDKNFANNLNSPNNRVLLSEFKKLIQGKKSNITANNLISLGMSSEVAPYVIDYFKRYWNSNPTPTNRPKMENGGILHLQPGGPIKHIGSQKFVSDKVNQLATQMQNPTDSKVIFDRNGLTDTDKLELAALITDLGSFAAGLLPGWGDAANLVGGQAANWMRFAIDRQRKKEGLNTHPWRNYLASTGADVLSVIPILGDAVNLGDFGRKAIPFFKRTYGVITTGLAGLGLYGAKDAIDKLLSGEDLTIEDIQALSTGLQSLTGLGMKAGMKIGDANLAVKTQPKQQIKHEFKFKDGEADVTKVLDAEDIKILTDTKGRNNINAALTKILKLKGIPEDQIPEMVKSFNYKDSGLDLHEYGKLGKDRITVIEPEPEHNTGYYLLRPKKRQEVLTNAKALDVASAGNPRAAARWFWRTGQELPEEYELKGKSYPMRTRVVDGKSELVDEIAPSKVTAEVPKPKTESTSESKVENPVENTSTFKNLEKPVTNDNLTSKPLETSSPHLTDPDLQVVETNQHFGSDEFDQKFAQYQAFIRGNGSPSTKKFKERFEKYAQNEDFRKLAEDNPELIRLMVDEEISNVLGKSKRSKNAEISLRKDLNRIKAKYDLKFKKGGILKGNTGFKVTPIGQTPAWKVQKIETPYSKELDKLFKANTILNPEGMITGSNIGGLRINYAPVTKVTTDSPVTETLSNLELYGQHPYEFSKANIMPEAINQTLSAGRLLWDFGTNNKLYDERAKGLIESSNAKMASMPQEIYSRQNINAGNAERLLGNRKLQALPAINNDYIKYAAMKRAGDNAALNHLANATLADSQQHSENLARQVEEQRMYANMRNQIEAHNRGVQAAKLVGLSELRAARTQANRQSFANYLLEKQTEFDQNRQLAEQLATSMSEYEAQKKANDEFIKERNAYFKNTPIDMGNSAYVQFLNDLRSSKMYDIKMAGYETQAQNQVGFWRRWLGFKSGGKVRSSQDQIKINKHKEFDQNWSNSNKDVRKAITKMNDRVHDIIMKILSDEV